jgi:NhaA family Na+:H+ antiporter
LAVRIKRTTTEALPTRPIDSVTGPLRTLAERELTGPLLLLGAAVVSLLVANSPWGAAVSKMWQLPVGVSWGDLSVDKTLVHWVNDGLMGLFFFLVGLEIKREVVAGELSEPRRAALPALAAVGGMLVPAALYALSASGAARRGWGVPMATDIAFALGVLALLGRRIPRGLVLFLTALAIVDDIGAVLVIAIFYTTSFSITALMVAGALLLVSLALNRAGVRSPLVFLVVGLAVWLAFVESGVHATVAAILMAWTVPARTRLDGVELRTRLEGQMAQLHDAGLPEDHSFNSPSQHRAIGDLESTAASATTPLARIEQRLQPWVTFAVLPLFALANAGVALDASPSPGGPDVAFAVALGLVVGKPVGITLFSWLAVKAGVAELPEGVTWLHVAGVGLLAGVGFTMALFIGGLAFTDTVHVEQAKLGVLFGSLASGALGYVWLRYWGSP